MPNDRGTAPGVLVELGGTPCYAMPGVPYEMGDDVRGAGCSGRKGRRLPVACWRRRCLRTTGVPEARLGARIADLMAEGRNPCVGVTTKLSIINVTISATAASDAEARRLLDETEREIRSRLGVAVFGMENDTLASVVGELLASAEPDAQHRRIVHRRADRQAADRRLRQQPVLLRRRGELCGRGQAGSAGRIGCDARAAWGRQRAGGRRDGSRRSAGVPERLCPVRDGCGGADRGDRREAGGIGLHRVGGSRSDVSQRAALRPAGPPGRRFARVLLSRRWIG